MPSGGHIRRGAGVVWRTAPGFLAVATREDDVAIVTGPGVDVWDLLATPIDLDSIVAALAGRYSERKDVIRADVAVLVDAMVAAGYLEVVDA